LLFSFASCFGVLCVWIRYIRPRASLCCLSLCLCVCHFQFFFFFFFGPGCCIKVINCPCCPMKTNQISKIASFSLRFWGGGLLYIGVLGVGVLGIDVSRPFILILIWM
jgi:hypothetical protein